MIQAGKPLCSKKLRGLSVRKVLPGSRQGKANLPLVLGILHFAASDDCVSQTSASFKGHILAAEVFIIASPSTLVHIVLSEGCQVLFIHLNAPAFSSYLQKYIKEMFFIQRYRILKISLNDKIKSLLKLGP